MAQIKQVEWHKQWSMFQNEELFLFEEWIHPNTLDDFREMAVLECGCGGGQHTSFIAPLAKQIVAVDLNTIECAKRQNEAFTNIKFVEADISEMDLKQEFDIVFSIGVVHHTDNPDRTVENLKRHVKEGGKLILWIYSKEGNFFAEHILERFRKIFLKRADIRFLAVLSKIMTAFLYVPVYTLYFLPLRFLPYYDYFTNFRRLSFKRNTLNVFDKLNAPQVEFISRERVAHWFDDETFEEILIDSYKGISWRVTARKR